MILVAGGSGLLGTQVVRSLLARGLRVRVLTRSAHATDHLKLEGVELVTGDVRDAVVSDHATVGVDAVVSAIHGFAGSGDVGPATVDHVGNRNLIQAAQANGVEHFVLMSVVGAQPNHPLELHRMKYLAEQELKASRLDWTIIRATSFMELWARLIGAPVLRAGKTTIFGRGENPINFVSVRDVARFVELAVIDPKLRGAVIEVGGPQNLTANQVARMFGALAGCDVSLRHVPVPAMRLASVLLRPLKPALARQIRAGVVMDTTEMRFDVAAIQSRFPAIPLTSFAEMARRDLAREKISRSSATPSLDTPR